MYVCVYMFIYVSFRAFQTFFIGGFFIYIDIYTIKILSFFHINYYCKLQESNKRNKKNQYRLESGKYFKKVADAINTLETVFQVFFILFH